MRRIVLITVAALILAACSGTQATNPPPTDAPSLGAETEVETSLDPTSTEVASSPTSTQADVQTAEPAPNTDVGQRSAPVGVDAGFHNDAATVFAATGNPQMIEFFAFW